LPWEGREKTVSFSLWKKSQKREGDQRAQELVCSGGGGKSWGTRALPEGKGGKKRRRYLKRGKLQVIKKREKASPTITFGKGRKEGRRP